MNNVIAIFGNPLSVRRQVWSRGFANPRSPPSRGWPFACGSGSCGSRPACPRCGAPRIQRFSTTTEPASPDSPVTASRRTAGGAVSCTASSFPTPVGSRSSSPSVNWPSYRTRFRFLTRVAAIASLALLFTYVMSGTASVCAFYAACAIIVLATWRTSSWIGVDGLIAGYKQRRHHAGPVAPVEARVATPARNSFRLAN